MAKEKTIDDLYNLFTGFSKNIEMDMRLIRESWQEFGTELANLRTEFRRHKSDVFRKIGHIQDQINSLECFRIKNDNRNTEKRDGQGTGEGHKEDDQQGC